MTECISRCSLLSAILITVGTTPFLANGQTARAKWLTMTFETDSNTPHEVIVQVSATNRITLHNENATMVDVVREVSRQCREPEGKQTRVNATNEEDMISISVDDVPLHDAIRMFTRIGPPAWSIDGDVQEEIIDIGLHSIALTFRGLMHSRRCSMHATFN